MAMRKLRGAVHMHTTLSHDGTMSLDDLVSFFRDREYDFIVVSDHSHDVSAPKMEGLVEQAERLSSDELLVIPSLEFTCHHTIHIVGVGVPKVCSEDHPSAVIDHIHEHGGFAILAHPWIRPYPLEESWVRKLDACEIWNVTNDGKYLPPARSRATFAKLRNWRPGLKAIGAQDMHRAVSFYPLANVVEAEKLERKAIIEALKAGRYRVVSKWFNCDSNGQLNGVSSVGLRLAGGALSTARWVRDRL